MTNEHSFRDRVAEYFKAKPHAWIDGMALEAIGGKYAWRSRVSDCRRQLGMDIRNRQQRQTDADGKTWTVSWYCYEPPVATVPAQPHNLNAASAGSLF
jgi:hypothetical protein